MIHRRSYSYWASIGVAIDPFPSGRGQGAGNLPINAAGASSLSRLASVLTKWIVASLLLVVAGLAARLSAQERPPAARATQTAAQPSAQASAPRYPVLGVDQAPFVATEVRYSGVGAWTFDTPDGPRSVGAGELVRYGSPVESGRRPLWVLNDGGFLVAEVTSISGGAVRGLHESFGPLAIETSQLRGLILRPPADREARDELLRRVEESAGMAGGDRLILVNGDQTSGKLQELTSEAAVLAIGQTSAQILKDRITAILFPSSPDEVRPPQSTIQLPTTLIGFRDGSLVRARSVAITANQVRAELSGGVTLQAAAPARVVFIQPLGGRVEYLSDMAADSYVHQPFLELSWPYERDRNVAGGRLAAGGALFAKGLGMHSGGRIAYRLDGPYQWFQAEVAVDDQTAGRGSVVFQVYLAKDGRWNLAWSSSTVRGGEAPLAVRVDVSGAAGVALSVDYADHGDQWDRADWLDVRLTKAASK